MGNASDIFGIVFKNGSATLLARVVGADNTPVQQADIASAEYSVYLLDDDDVQFEGVLTAEEVLAKKRMEAEEKGEVVEIS